ncbi:N-ACETYLGLUTAMATE SYNTHASE, MITOCHONDRIAL [Ceraceosorus bombacis]|uniref:N-ACETYLGLUTAMATE SYNTHASE, MITOCHONDRIAL n=1 Tax=Ceraceosorus bombacis TaxID=401625 RepID=A0A0P1BPS0_9BASI|nr:N-ACETYLGLUTAMATE SYNTHASE, MITOCHONDRIAL [Ceraceosorus bombacis]
MGSKRPMQSLILEILNAQPSLRDSKTYLNSFAPRTRLKLPNSFQLPPPPIARPAKPNKHSDDVNRPEHLASRHSTSQEQQELIPAKDGTEAALQPELSPGPITQQHTALVKVQGPFTDRQLESIAEGMVYLKKLGLVSVIVMDSEEATWSSGMSHFASVDGRRLDASEMDEVEEASMAPWLGEAAVRAKGAAKAAAGSKGRRLGLAQEALRKRLVADVYKLSELLSQKGAPARPFPQAVMRVDAEAVTARHAASPPHFPERAPRRSAREGKAGHCWAKQTASAQGQNLEAKASLAAASSSSSSVTAAGGNLMSAVHRSPVASDDDLSTLRSALASDQIPVLAPLALYSDPEEHGAERTVCVSADDVLVGLARDMSAAARAEETAALQGQGLEDGVDMMPLRLMVM